MATGLRNKVGIRIVGGGVLPLIYYKNDNANGETMLSLTSTILNSPYIVT